MQSTARLLLNHAETHGWYIVVNSELTTQSAATAWEAVKAVSDDVHVVFFDRKRRLGSVFLSGVDAKILGHTQYGIIAATIQGLQ